MFFCGVNSVYANLEITEIMYAPESGSDYEWVEILNTGPDSVDLDKYRFFHGETTSGPITLKVGDDTVLQSGEYAIIAKSLSDYSWLNTSVIIFSSSVLSLPDSGNNTYIAISNPNKNIIDSVTYNTSLGGSKVSKNSLSKINGEWQGEIPSPGESNQNSSSGDEDTENINNSSNPSPSPTSNIPEILRITTKILLPKTAVAGIPTSVNSLTTTNRGEIYAVGNFVWNFGDGMVVKTKEAGPFTYLYEYPGEYAVTLSYFDSLLKKEADATNKVVIKVIPSEIYISGVGDTVDPFIEIENKSNYEIIISNWIITAGIHYFTIPEGTTILPSKKIKFSPKITGFVGEDLGSVIISTQNKDIVSTYPIQTKKSIQKNLSSVKSSSNNFILENNILQNDSSLKDLQSINLNDLSANAEKSGINISNSVYPILGLLGIITIGIVSFLLIKKKKDIPDYIEKEINAKDIKIIE